MQLLMDLTPDRFYLIVEFFVAELQKFLLAKRLHAATTATYFCPQGGPCVRKLFTGLMMYLPSQNKEHCIVLYCGEVQLYLKIPWNFKIIMYTYMQLCRIFNFLFSFSGRREKKRVVLNRVGADLQTFKSGSNNRGVA